MDNIGKADQVKKDADQCLFEYGLDSCLSQFGKLIHTGSFFLDLLAWPDLDLYLDIGDQPPEPIYAEIVKGLILQKECSHLKVFKRRSLNFWI